MHGVRCELQFQLGRTASAAAHRMPMFIMCMHQSPLPHTTTNQHSAFSVVLAFFAVVSEWTIEKHGRATNQGYTLRVSTINTRIYPLGEHLGEHAGYFG